MNFQQILAWRSKSAFENGYRYPLGTTVTVVPPGSGLRPQLSVQEGIENLGGIIRGGVVPTDPAVEVADELRGRFLDYCVVRKANGSLEAIIGALNRKYVWTVRQHAEAYETRFPDDRVAGVIGDGNLTANDGCVGSMKGRGVLRPLSFPLAERPLASFLVRTSGDASIEDLRYQSEVQESGVFDPHGKVEVVPNGEGQPPADDVIWSTSGQQLVRDCRAITFEELTDTIADGDIPDLNHGFGYGWMKVADLDPSPFTQVGYRVFVDADGKFHGDLLRDAMNGKPITIPLDEDLIQRQCGYDNRTEFEEALHRSLGRRYERVESEPLSLGQYSVKDDQLRIVLLPGTYPHSLIGVSKLNRVVLIQVARPHGGALAGNRSAATLLGVAQAAVAGAKRSLARFADDDELRDAILLDNGGDVFFWTRQPNDGWFPRVASEMQRDRLRSVILWVSDRKGPVSMPASDFWPIEDLFPTAKWVVDGAKCGRFVESRS